MSWKNLPFLVIDTETSGLDNNLNRVIELGYAIVSEGKVQHTGAWLLDPGLTLLDPKITEITGLTLGHLKGKPAFSEVLPYLKKMMEASAFCAGYNTPFDTGFLRSEFRRAGQDFPEVIWLDPLVWSRKLEPYPWKLGAVTERLGIKMEKAHSAASDAKATAELILLLRERLPDDLGQVRALEIKWKGETQHRKTR